MRLFSHWRWFTLECIGPCEFLKGSFKILSLKQTSLSALWYPSHFSQHAGSPAKFGSPISWIEMDLNEVSKPKIVGSKAQQTRLICWKNQCQTKHMVYAGKPTSINPIQVKFMRHMSSWFYKRLKYLRVSLFVEFMHAWHTARNIRLLSYYQQQFLISFTFKHMKIKQVHARASLTHLAGSKSILKT